MCSCLSQSHCGSQQEFHRVIFVLKDKGRETKEKLKERNGERELERETANKRPSHLTAKTQSHLTEFSREKHTLVLHQWHCASYFTTRPCGPSPPCSLDKSLQGKRYIKRRSRVHYGQNKKHTARWLLNDCHLNITIQPFG